MRTYIKAFHALEILKKENKKFQENAQEQQPKSEATLYHFLDVHQKMVADKAISEDQAAQLRKVINDRPVAVTYELTEFGHSALGILEHLRAWSESNLIET